MREDDGEQGEQMRQGEEAAERRRRRGRPHHKESLVGKKIQETKLDSWQYHLSISLFVCSDVCMF